MFGMARPANAVLALVALVLGTAVFALLAAVTAAVTRTVEMAQVTTLPVLIIPVALSGLRIPLATLPDPLRAPRPGDPASGDGAAHDAAGADNPGCSQRPADPAGHAARAAAVGRPGAAADTSSGTDAARADRNDRRRSSPRRRRGLRRGSHPGARARGLDRGRRMGCATLVPLGTAALRMTCQAGAVMAMRWQRSSPSGPGRFDFYHRASMYALLAAGPLLALLFAQDGQQVRIPAMAVFLLLSVAQAGVCVGLLRASLSPYPI